MAMLRRFYTTKAVEVSDRVFRFVISNETKDRHGTIIKVGGWKLDNYALNPIVFYQHLSWSSDPDYVVGKGVVWVENNELWAECHFEPEGENEIADKLVKKLRFGSINATSVGFDPFAYGMGDTKIPGESPDEFYFREQDLLEFSIVNLPSNPTATSKSVDELNDESIEGFIAKVKASQPPAEVTIPDPTIPTPEIKAPTPGPDPYRTQLLKLKRSTL